MSTPNEKMEAQFGLITSALNKRGCKYIRNKSICGTGKTTMTCEVLVTRQALGIDERTIIAMPNHELCEEFAQKYSGVHLYGKKWFCTHGHQWEMECPKDCKMTCRYYAQQFNAPLIFCPYEMIGKCHSDITFRSSTKLNLVIEEIPDRIICPTMQISPSMQLRYGEPTIIQDHNRDWSYQQVVGFSMHFPQTLEDFRLYRFLNHAENVISDGHTLYSLNHLDTSRFKKVIFNCATTPESFQQLFMSRRVETIDIQEKITNPILYFKGKFTKVAAEAWLPQIHAFKGKLELLGKKVFFGTKQAFCETDDDAHYGLGRGLNKFNQDWDCGIIYGEYHYPPQFRHALSLLLGFDCHEMLQQLERAEVEQLMHRMRPYLHATTPILIFSNRLLITGDHIQLSNKQAIEDYTNNVSPSDWYNRMALHILKLFLHNPSDFADEDYETYYQMELQNE